MWGEEGVGGSGDEGGGTHTYKQTNKNNNVQEQEWFTLRLTCKFVFLYVETVSGSKDYCPVFNTNWLCLMPMYTRVAECA